MLGGFIIAKGHQARETQSQTSSVHWRTSNLIGADSNNDRWFGPNIRSKNPSLRSGTFSRLRRDETFLNINIFRFLLSFERVDSALHFQPLLISQAGTNPRDCLKCVSLIVINSNQKSADTKACSFSPTRIVTQNNAIDRVFQLSAF